MIRIMLRRLAATVRCDAKLSGRALNGKITYEYVWVWADEVTAVESGQRPITPRLLLRAGHLWLEAAGRRGGCAGARMRRRVLRVGRSGSGRGLALYRVRATRSTADCRSINVSVHRTGDELAARRRPQARRADQRPRPARRPNRLAAIQTSSPAAITASPSEPVRQSGIATRWRNGQARRRPLDVSRSAARWER